MAAKAGWGRKRDNPELITAKLPALQAVRGPKRRYVTTPLRALFDTQKIHRGGFYHDGRFATLDAVVNHYDSHFNLKLTAEQKRDLIEHPAVPRVAVSASR